MKGSLHFSSIILSVLALGSLLGGCATSSSPENDPYESFNRRMFAVNDALDRNVAVPAAKVYRTVLPKPAQDGLHNVLANLNSPVTFANDILQGEPLLAAKTLGRAIVNSSIGLAGIVDVATPMGIPGHEKDFGETLAIWGVGEGPYLVIPLIGPSNPRDLTGRVVDIGFDPLTYAGMREKGWWMGSRQLSSLLDERARNIDTMDELRRSSVDLYATLRSLYRQHRNAEIHGGKPDLQNLPNI